jgi:hypothetical protein
MTPVFAPSRGRSARVARGEPYVAIILATAAAP